jgi:hypothetical protein
VRDYWVFNIGTAEWRPDEDWLATWRHHTQEMWFTPNKKPTGVRPGDRAVMHGSGGRGFFAVMEVTSREPEPNLAEDAEDRRRWPWILHYKLLVAIRADEHAPSLANVDRPNPRPCAASRTCGVRRPPHPHPALHAALERQDRAVLRHPGDEWAHGRIWPNSRQRDRALSSWLRFYNRRRPHSAAGGHAPITRVQQDRKQDT